MVGVAIAQVRVKGVFVVRKFNPLEVKWMLAEDGLCAPRLAGVEESPVEFAAQINALLAGGINVGC